MAVTSGFFNSSNHDRLYSNMDIGRMFDGVIGDGVFAGVGNHFLVSASTGMGITVGTGRAWFNNTWTYNDASLPLTVPAAGSAVRYDWVVLEINKNDSVRANSIKIETGTSNNSWPDFIRSKAQTLGDNVSWKPIARIQVPANATSIAASNITMFAGEEYCPYVKSAVDNIDIGTIMDNYNQQFLEWWNQLQHDMGSDVASGLQAEISQLRTDLTTETSARERMDTGITDALKADLFKRVSCSASYTLAANTRLEKQVTFSAPAGYKYAGIVGFDAGHKDVCVITTKKVSDSKAAMVVRNVSNAQVSATLTFTILFIRDFSQYVFTGSGTLGG